MRFFIHVNDHSDETTLSEGIDERLWSLIYAFSFRSEEHEDIKRTGESFTSGRKARSPFSL